MVAAGGCSGKGRTGGKPNKQTKPVTVTVTLCRHIAAAGQGRVGEKKNERMMGWAVCQFSMILCQLSRLCVWPYLPRCTMMASYRPPDQARSSAMPVLCAWACRGRPRTPCDVRHGSPTSHTHAGEVPGANLCTAHGTTATATVRYGTAVRESGTAISVPSRPSHR